MIKAHALDPRVCLHQRRAHLSETRRGVRSGLVRPDPEVELVASLHAQRELREAVVRGDGENKFTLTGLRIVTGNY
jgi:hypothetical protein